MAIKVSRKFTLEKAKERVRATKLPVDRSSVGRRTLDIGKKKNSNGQNKYRPE
jgi:hypothetical protein